MTEAEARAWLCAELPSLRQSAQEGGWTAALEDALAVLDEGGTALDVLALLDPGSPAGRPDRRGDLASYLLFGVDAPALRGDYTCPDGWCSRRAGRDARNRPPVCPLRGRPMRFIEQ
ncbi:hypothetical protein AB0K40_10230 [Nonomuraea bangladeshensis]|uniref:Uncharacterized protein n=1 Tax=Nonomuraea bangladeshensis TaxID=404385 RepID=A0ABV3GZZ9_9ACTN